MTNSMTQTFAAVTMACTKELCTNDNWSNVQCQGATRSEAEYIPDCSRTGTFFMPTHSSPVMIKTRIAAQGSTTISSPGMLTRAKKEGKPSGPPKNKAWNIKMMLHKVKVFFISKWAHQIMVPCWHNDTTKGVW